MKTRIIQTRFYEDSFIRKLSLEAQHLFLYLITCRYINISGIFELPDDIIMFESKLSQKQLDRARSELIGKIDFYDGWVCVRNAEKNNKYRNSPQNEKAYEKELEIVPSSIKAHFDSSIDTSMDSSIYTNYKSEIINNKSEILNNKEKKKEKKAEWDMESLKDGRVEKELSKEYPERYVAGEITMMINWLEASGKVYKNYLAFAKNWCARSYEDWQVKRNKGFSRSNEEEWKKKKQETRILYQEV